MTLSISSKNCHDVTVAHNDSIWNTVMENKIKKIQMTETQCRGGKVGGDTNLMFSV